MYALGSAVDDNTLNSNCSIEINGEILSVVNGFVIDPLTNSKTKIEFFYLSECDKMVHIDFEDGLEELKYSMNHHKCKKVKDKIVQNGTNENQFEYVCQKLEDIYKKIDDLMHGNKDQQQQQQRLSNQRNETRVVVDVHAEDTSTNTTSDSELNKPLIKINGANNNKPIQPLQNKIVRELKDEQASVRELTHSEISFCIPANDLKDISRWAKKNTSFLPYKGMLEVPKETIESDDKYLIALLYALNPIVVLEQLFSLDSQRPKYTSVHVESSGELSQEEFAKYLGLTQRKTYEDSLRNPSHSKKLRSKSNLARQNDNKSSNTPTPSTHSQNKSENSEIKAISSNSNSKNNNNNVKEETSQIDKLKFTKLDTWKPRKSLLRKVKKDSMSLNLKHSKDKYRIEEDRVILDWVLKNKNARKVNGNTIWQDLENLNLPAIKDRSWQSLRNRFLKNILSQLKEYGLEKDAQHKIIHGAQKGMLHRKDKFNLSTKPNYGLIVKKNDSDKTNSKKDTPKNTNEKKRDKPELRSAKRKRDDVENHGIYSDIDILSDEVLDVPYSQYKLERSAEKKPLSENPTYTTRSKGRKLFTQRTFVASISDSISVG